MSIEILRSIRQAETEAEQIIRTSQAQARQILSEAEKSSGKLLEKLEEQALQESAGIISTAEKEEEVNTAQLKAQVQKECEALREKAGGRIKSAVDVILERIVKAYGNS